MLEDERKAIRAALLAAAFSGGAKERLEEQVGGLLAMVLPRRRTSAATMVGCMVVAFVGFVIFAGYLAATAGELPRPIRSNIYMLSAAGALLFAVGTAFVLGEVKGSAMAALRSRGAAVGIVYWFGSALSISTMSLASAEEGAAAEMLPVSYLHLWLVTAAFLLLCAAAGGRLVLNLIRRHRERVALEGKRRRLEVARAHGASGEAPG